MFDISRYLVGYYGRIRFRHIQQPQYRHEGVDVYHACDINTYVDSVFIRYEYLGARAGISLGLLGSSRFVRAYIACSRSLSQTQEIALSWVVADYVARYC